MAAERSEYAPKPDCSSRGVNDYSIAAANRIAAAIRRRMVELRKRRYAGFNDQHFNEKLLEVESIAVSRSTVRRVLRAAGIASPRSRRAPRHRRRRERRAQADGRSGLIARRTVRLLCASAGALLLLPCINSSQHPGSRPGRGPARAGSPPVDTEVPLSR